VTSKEWREKLLLIKDSFSLSLSDKSASAEALELRYLGRKGELSLLLRDLKDIPLEDRKQLGALGNAAKVEFTQALGGFKGGCPGKKEVRSDLDLTLPGTYIPKGGLHPITQTINRLSEAFLKLGFSMADGPLVEDDYHNFEALNFPAYHPARDMQDTFYVNLKDKTGKDRLMRTQTSGVQIRSMEGKEPPFRIFSPGRVFRNEAVDASHSFMFHQVEGLYVDKGVSMADLKWTVDAFIRDLFGNTVQTRFQPSYFPFTEPSAEVEMSCIFCNGKKEHCPVCKGSGWIEVLGSGVVHPNVLRACGCDPEKWSGFALGVGVERFTMLLYGINDMRTLFENDIRILRQVQ